MLTDKSLQHQPQNIQRYAGIIKEENQRLEGHVEKVLQFARLERGSINLRNENIDLVELLDNILQKTMLQVQTVEGELHYEPADEDLTIWGDKEHIQNMIYNLLDNAIKYSKQCPIITVKTSKTPDGYVSIAGSLNTVQLSDVEYS
jgi:two-component system phosphate regulon sensor histidine kinase PhoR